jgi:hypothetical protein
VLEATSERNNRHEERLFDSYSRGLYLAREERIVATSYVGHADDVTSFGKGANGKTVDGIVHASWLGNSRFSPATRRWHRHHCAKPCRRDLRAMIRNSSAISTLDSLYSLCYGFLY